MENETNVRQEARLEAAVGPSLNVGDTVFAGGRTGVVVSVHRPEWIDHKSRGYRTETKGADIHFGDTYPDGVKWNIYYPLRDIYTMPNTTYADRASSESNDVPPNS